MRCHVPVSVSRAASVLFVAFLVADSLPQPATIFAGRNTSLAKSDPAGYWHTSGITILNSAGKPARINGVTWYGMEGSHWVPAGLDFQPYGSIMDEVKLLGFNTIRLPFSNELVERNPVVTSMVAANRQLRGTPAMHVLDLIVAYAKRIGLKLILDDQQDRAARPQEAGLVYPSLWYSRDYPESSWIRDWVSLARRYRGNDAVIGFDLRNEPHPSGTGPWDLSAYLTRSPTWGPYRGVAHRATDWRLAAQRAGNAILTVNPNLLIIVQGIARYPDSAPPRGMMASWWAGILTPARDYPVQLRVSHRLVYSVHDWGPRKFSMPWFDHMTYQSLQAVWHRNWSFILDKPHALYAAPILLGEFGTCTGTPLCVHSRRRGSQGAWFGMLLRYFRTHPQVSWSFYALNGTNANDCRADNGLLSPEWNAVASVDLEAALRGIQTVPGMLPARGHSLAARSLSGKRPLGVKARICRPHT
jgi:endoglucanase